MRARAIVGSIVASAAVLIVGWEAGNTALVPPQATTSSTTTGVGNTAATYTGSSVQTRFGLVQVAVTVSAGTITDVTALHLTDDGRKSVQISNRAAPILRDEVIASQSANVSNVSGATYTANAYLESLQSALDQAGL